MTDTGRVLRPISPPVQGLQWKDWILFGLLSLGLLLCLRTNTGFDLFGTFWLTTSLLFPFLFVLFVGTRALFILPREFNPQFSLLKALSQFRDAGSDEILRLDRCVVWGFFLLVCSVTVYANLKVRLPVIHDATMQDEKVATILPSFALWLEEWAATNDVVFALLAMAFAGGFVIMGLLLFFLYLRRDVFHLRWLSYSLCYVVVLSMLISLALPTLGPFFTDPDRFLWLQGTQFFDHHHDLSNVLSLSYEAASSPEFLRAHPLMGVASFPSLRIGVLVVFTVVALRAIPGYGLVLVLGTLMTGLAAIAFGFNYTIDVLAALFLGVLVTEILYRQMLPRRASPSSSSTHQSEQEVAQ